MSMITAAAAGQDADIQPVTIHSHSEVPMDLLMFDEIDSTQKWMERNVNDLIASRRLSPRRWTRVSAVSQTCGVGTLNSATQEQRRWVSPPGNVYVTFAIPWPKAEREKLTNFSHVATFAVTTVLEKFGVSPKIRWINDIMVRDRKLAGVLSTVPAIRQTLIDEDEEFLIVLLGIGVNVADDGQQFIDTKSTHLRREISIVEESCETKSNSDLERKESLVAAVLELLTTEIYNTFHKLKVEGFESFLKFIESHLLWKGENVVVDTDLETFTGVSLGLTAEGHLKLRLPSGEQRTFCVGHLTKF